jgi:hypothetical protein
MLPKIRWRNARVEFEYDQMRSCLPESKMYSLEEYAWARCVVAGRVHSATISGKPDAALIPLADMLHHSTRPNVSWQAECSMGMISTAARDIESGEPLTISYGTACNGYWFLTYGFCLENNPHNVAEIHLPCHVRVFHGKGGRRSHQPGKRARSVIRTGAGLPAAAPAVRHVG